MFTTKFVVECLQVAGTWGTRDERPMLPLRQGKQFSGEASALQWIAPGAEVRVFPGLPAWPSLATAPHGIYFGDPTRHPHSP